MEVFKTINEITQFLEMNKTEQSMFVSNILKNDVKICSNIYYIYSIENRLWEILNEDCFITYMHKFYNNISKNILNVVAGLKDKRIDKLLLEIDKSSYVKDIISRMNGDLQCAGFTNKTNQLKDFLPITNGQKISLIDGKISERTKEDCFTFSTNVNITKSTKNADKFFSEVMPIKAHREYLRKVLGYCLTGRTDARCFFIFYGVGSNGKSKVNDIMEKILSKFHVQCSDEVFQKTKTDGKPSPHLTCLLNKRFGFYSEGETADEMSLNLAVIKRISGQDKITARNLYQGLIEFYSDCKLCMGTNYVPPIGAEKAMVDRLRYLFFDSVFADNPKKGEFKKDDEFVNNIMTKYLDEVFTWILQGSKEYYKDSTLIMPGDWKTKTTKLLEQEDSIETFLKRFISITKNEKDYIRKKNIFETYKSFCDTNSQRCQPRSSLFNRLEHLKVETKVLHGYDVFRKIKCSYNKSCEDEDEDDEEDAVVDEKIDETDIIDPNETVKELNVLKEENAWLKDEIKRLSTNRVEVDKDDNETISKPTKIKKNRTKTNKSITIQNKDLEIIDFEEAEINFI